MFDDVEFYLEDLESRFKGIDYDKYFLSYSGGRDSHFLWWFIKTRLAGSGIEIVGSNTFLEHPEIRDRMIKKCDVIVYPKHKPEYIKQKYGIPCFSKGQDDIIGRYKRKVKSGKPIPQYLQKAITQTASESRFGLNKKALEVIQDENSHMISDMCCYHFKKAPINNYANKTGKKQILGVRASEGKIRQFRYNSCFTSKGVFTPIYDLTDEMLKAIEEKYNIEVPSIYNHIDRTGCMGCPYGSYMGNTEVELELLDDAQRDFIIDYFKESYDLLGVKYGKEKL